MYPSGMSLLTPRYAFVLALSMTVLTSCSSTQVTTLFQDPTTTQLRFTKVLSLAIVKDQDLRDAAEGEFCRHITSVECKAAYFAIPDSMISDVDAARALTLKEGFDGALVVRVVAAGERVTYVPPTYRTFWGYYGYAWPVAINPGFYQATEVVQLEIAIFSLTQDKVLWVGTTETIEPKSLPQLVDDVAKAVRGELLRRDLIPAS
jgi:hypothetical protein